MGDRNKLTDRLTAYRVRVGFAEVTVRCSDDDQALALARSQLCAEHPRLWDVIHGLGAGRFEVARLGTDAEAPGAAGGAPARAAPDQAAPHVSESPAAAEQ